MARKKKNLKDINEHEFTHSCLQDPTLKRASLDEHMLQENQQHTEEQQAQDKQQQQHEQQQQQPHNSDSEIMDVKLKNLQVDKNKSNLFLIKSYSFIDKTNAKRPKNLNVKTKLEEFEKFHTLMLDQASSSSPTKENLEKSENIADKEKSEKLKKTEKIKKLEKLEKPKKPPKLKKLKKSKSSYDSTEHLQEFQDILRKPSIILENEVKLTSTPRRPQSMPVAQSQHKPVMKSKTLDDLETNHIKRDSFIRHSLQSIRRSFSSSKKYNQHNISFTSSSSSSSSSASSGSDNSGKLSKSKTKDIGNLKDVEDHNDLIMEEEEAEHQQDKRSCNIVITVNDVLTLEEPSNHPCANNNNNHLKDSILKSASLSTASSSAAAVPKVAAQPAAAGSSLAHMDALAVLKEEDEKDLLNNNNNNNNISSPCLGSEQRSTSSVSTLAQLQNTDSVTPMAPLQTHTECHSVQCLNSLESDFKSSSSSSSPPQISKRVFQHQLSTPESLQSTSIGCATSSEYSSARSLKHSSTSLVPLQTLHSSSSLRSISPSRRSASSNSSSTAKHEQSPAAATAAAAATATTSTTPSEKEKKRKEVSSSRVKKFQRHFSQVSKDEKLINYFSCALVSDILLQGHLYITDHHFAFYSNVFGYVTKVVIPTSSVTKISKEKTAKIIPNAVGVATADERHVFGSFISREAAFRLMSSVCPPLGIVEILPKDPGQIEISEEYSIEDDSSCSISGNESPAQTTDMLNSTNHSNDTSQTILRRSVGTSNLSIADSTNDMLRHSDIPSNAKTATTTASLRASAPAAYVNGNGGVMNLIGLKSVLQPALPTAGLESNLTIIAGCTSSTTSATSTPTPSTSSSPTTVMNLPNSKANQVMNVFKSVSDKIMVNIKFPTEIHVVYLGVMLTLLLAIFSIFLLYRILDIEAKTSSYRSPVEFNWRSGNDDDIFNEALRFQKQLQLKSTEEAQNILKTNLEQIAKVRRSLETLSMLIHDRSSSFVANSNIDDSDD